MFHFIHVSFMNSFFTVIHGKHFVTMISLMLVFIIVKYLHSYFVRFVNVALPYVRRCGTLFATGHSSSAQYEDGAVDA